MWVGKLWPGAFCGVLGCWLLRALWQASHPRHLTLIVSTITLRSYGIWASPAVCRHDVGRQNSTTVGEDILFFVSYFVIFVIFMTFIPYQSWFILLPSQRDKSHWFLSVELCRTLKKIVLFHGPISIESQSMHLIVVWYTATYSS